MAAAVTPTVTHALVFHGPHTLRWEERPIQQPAADEVTLAPRAIGICGSDIHGYTGESSRRKAPMVMGHEAVGEIVALGEHVDSDWLGKQVVLQPFVYCEACDYCLSGQTNLCRNRKFFGGNINGAMAESLIVPLNNVIPIPLGCDARQAVLTEPMSVALHAVNRAGDLSGKRVLIAGCGPIGLLTLVAVQRAGAESVTMTDIVETRRHAAQSLGAAAIHPHDLGETEVDLSFDAVGITATFQQAVDVTRPGGTVIALGGWQTLPINLAQVVAKELNIQASFNFVPAEFHEALQLLAQNPQIAEVLVTDQRPITHGAEVFEALVASPGETIKFILTADKR